MKKLIDLRACDRLRQQHDIHIRNRLLRACLPLDPLCLRKVHKTMLRDRFRQDIARHRDHPVRNDAAVVRDGDITRTGAHINQCDIQHPKPLRDRKLDRCDRL